MLPGAGTNYERKKYRKKYRKLPEKLLRLDPTFKKEGTSKFSKFELRCPSGKNIDQRRWQTELVLRKH